MNIVKKQQRRIYTFTIGGVEFNATLLKNQGKPWDVEDIKSDGPTFSQSLEAMKSINETLIHLNSIREENKKKDKKVVKLVNNSKKETKRPVGRPKSKRPVGRPRKNND